MTKHLNAILGIRVENNSQKLDSYDLVNNPLNYNNTKTNALPSANVTYNLSEKSLFRMAYGQTLNRPEFREMVRTKLASKIENLTLLNQELEKCLNSAKYLQLRGFAK